MSDAIKQNEHIYDRLWARLPIPPHSEWPIWPELEKEIHGSARLLEMGAGVLPRIPIDGGFFVDLSQSALRKLDVHGGHGVRAAGPLPFCDEAFDVVCAFEVLEHIPDDETVLSELARVIRPGGALFFSVPVNPALWTGFDDACGHVRRYIASDLAQRLDDVLCRRMPLLLLARDQGLACAEQVARRMAAIRGWTDERTAKELATYRDSVELSRQFRKVPSGK